MTPRFLPVFLVLLLSTAASAQTPVTKPESFDYYLELITELSQHIEQETDFNDMADELYDLWQSPIDINNAGRFDISRLFWLSEFQINSLIEYVYQHKPVVSLYELAYAPGFDTSAVLSLKPFIVLNNTDKRGDRKQSKQMLLLRAGRVLERQTGYTTNKLEGDAWKQNLRYKYQYGEKVSAGLSLEKDAGEAVFKGSNRAGPDYYSGYLKINNIGMIKTICAGNYSIGFGQGLILGPGFVLGKSSQATNLVQKEVGIRPYTSSDENRYLQGIASEISFNPFDLTVFLSYKHIDANITATDSAKNVTEVSSLQNTGYHSTESEIADENSLAEFSAGGRISFNKSRFRTGISFIHSAFDAEISPTPSNYNQFYFRGDQQNNVSFDYKLNLSNTTFFGEEALDGQGNLAALNGVTSNLAGRLQLSLLHRYYSKAYHAFYGNAFGENSRVQNEEGTYAGFKLSLIKHWNLSFYADFFRFPWLKDGVDAPSNGQEFLIQTDYAPSDIFTGYIQYRYKQKQANLLNGDNNYYSIVDSKTQRLRFQLNYKAGDQIVLATRLETSFYTKGDSATDRGFLLYQDFRYTFAFVPVNIYLRYALFDTDSYNSRMYAYENDVLYAFSVNAYYKEGQRYYIMLKCSPMKMMDLWIKYSQTVYPHEKSISSGVYQINGNSRSEIRLQMILKF